MGMKYCFHNNPFSELLDDTQGISNTEIRTERHCFYFSANKGEAPAGSVCSWCVCGTVSAMALIDSFDHSLKIHRYCVTLMVLSITRSCNFCSTLYPKRYNDPPRWSIRLDWWEPKLIFLICDACYTFSALFRLSVVFIWIILRSCRAEDVEHFRYKKWEKSHRLTILRTYLTLLLLGLKQVVPVYPSWFMTLCCRIHHPRNEHRRQVLWIGVTEVTWQSAPTYIIWCIPAGKGCIPA